MEFKNNELLRQFEGKNKEHSWRVEYALQEKKIFLTKFFSSENSNLEDAYPFLHMIMEHVTLHNYKMMPTATVIVQFVKKHPHYKSLLPVGIKM